MTTALYRRYRPDTFGDLIGQEHVTHALETALSTSRIAHAYLFSGPRGCGKTTSARILARSLNCAVGPTPNPCGTCESCIELGTGGPGSLDVIEIDAASNNGVDHARSLRERAEFATVRDRYRIYILDEAHMVTAAGFNALLKLVEEPPDHVKFIFATTEPEKVISTIRSRTHHYPFRLVPPNVLMPFLRNICAREGVTVDEDVLPLVVRAGGGSVRDSLSVLDQLIAGSESNVTYREATRLLGFTDSVLLDRIVDALGANDGAAAFAVVEEVVEAGHEPRRFVEDLLQRLRDLIVCALAGPVRAADILEGTPSDQLANMLLQANQWGTKLLSRRADLVEEALRDMTGATAPRLQLELLLARLLVEHPASQVEPVPPRGLAEGTSSVSSAKASFVPSPTAPMSPGAPSAPTTRAQQVPAPVDTPRATPTVTRAEPATAVAPKDSAQVGPTEDQVRSQWKPLLAALGELSVMNRSLMGATRAVASEDGTVRFTFSDQTFVDRFKASDGEKNLGAVLSELFQQPLTAHVGTAQDLSEPAEPERSPGSPVAAREPDASDFAEEVPAPEAPDVEVPAAGVPVSAGPAPVAATAIEPLGLEQIPHAIEPEPAAEDTSPEVDPDAKYRSMLPVDRVLDILGGQITDETLEQPESQ